MFFEESVVLIVVKEVVALEDVVAGKTVTLVVVEGLVFEEMDMEFISVVGLVYVMVVVLFIVGKVMGVGEVAFVEEMVVIAGVVVRPVLMMVAVVFGLLVGGVV